MYSFVYDFTLYSTTLVHKRDTNILTVGILRDILSYNHRVVPFKQSACIMARVL